MKECISCHKEIGDVKFCGHCGERQVCQECGVQFDRVSSFCLNCGTKRDGSSESGEQQSPLADPEEQTVGTNQAAQPAQVNKSDHESVSQVTEQGVQQQSSEQVEQKNTFVESIKQTAQKLGKRNLSIIGGILIVLIAFFIFQESSDSPEKVVEKYFTALSDGDLEKVKQYVDPLVWEEMLDDEVIEVIELLKKLDVTIELLDLEQVDTGEDYIDFEATVKYNSDFIDDEDDDWELVTVEVMQYGDKWYVSDVY